VLYSAYQSYFEFCAPIRAMAQAAHLALWSAAGTADPFGLRPAAAAWELLSRSELSHARPAFGIDRVAVGDREAAIVEAPVAATPFGTLLHFRKDVEAVQPRVLIVAPLSGHFATLLRPTVRTLLAEHDVFITDWHNARDVAVSDGSFGFDDQVEHVIRFLELVGPGAHVVAVCQPCVEVLAAAAVMAAAGHTAQPRSMTLMAGPVDARVNPTKVNELATGKPLDWFERTLIATVPGPHRGAGRKVYPGFAQLLAFMQLDIGRHLRAHRDLYGHLARGEAEKAATIKAFYDEYFSVADLPAEFYLDTVRKVFQEASLATGALTFRGERVDPRAIRRTALLTVEGKRDEICAPGQTAAAHALCSGLHPEMKRRLQAAVGHYGVFSGRRWESRIYPAIRDFIRSTD